MKVYVTRDDRIDSPEPGCCLVKVWMFEPKKKGGIYIFGEWCLLFKFRVVEFERYFGYTPGIGSCRERELTL